MDTDEPNAACAATTGLTADERRWTQIGFISSALICVHLRSTFLFKAHRHGLRIRPWQAGWRHGHQPQGLLREKGVQSSKDSIFRQVWLGCGHADGAEAEIQHARLTPVRRREGEEQEPANVVRKPANVIRKLVNVVRKPGNAVRKLGNAVRKSVNVVRKPGNVIRNPGNVIRNPGNVVRKPGNVVRKSGNIVCKSGDPVKMKSFGQNCFKSRFLAGNRQNRAPGSR